MNTPVSKKAEGWSMTLSLLKEGPDTYPAGGLAVGPGPGEIFLAAQVTVKNEAAEEQNFSYEACNLDAKDRLCRPTVVDKQMEGDSTADLSEDFPAGQERSRRLIFSYPKGERPKRLKCGSLVLPIPAAR